MKIQTKTRRLFEDILGCKWTLGILDALATGTVRPGRIRRAIPGLTTKVMQQRFRKLERWHLISKALVSAKPLHVEYRLTPKGRQLFRLLSSVGRFAERWKDFPGSEA
jgi:DNA-binding HxlR family transcriptional regulator